MKQLTTLWQFSRPHTIIGSVISICTLYAIAIHGTPAHHFFLLFLALVIGVTSNIFIVGINQIADIAIDRINKPYLPLPSGALTIRQARIIVYTALCTSLLVAVAINTYLFGIIAFSMAIGWAYSMPPLYLKQHHLTAALAITVVRGVVVNVGGFLVFNYLMNHSLDMPRDIKILTVFIIAFSIVISWFKDLPDVTGDSKYNIRTFAILYSPRTAFITGNVLLASAYAFTIAVLWREYAAGLPDSPGTELLLYGHIFLFVCFLVNSITARLSETGSVRKFYKRFWWFFFAEYALYLAVYLIIK
jgi:homogentisate phytyltransferase / homogentisate geranylgeranyltransferase